MRKWRGTPGSSAPLSAMPATGSSGATAAGDAAAKTAALADLIGRFTAEAAKQEGNLIVEAAPAALKEKVNVWGEPRNDTVVMRRLKEKIDPVGVLNPGRFVGGI